jgi:glycosyltransferase involved in cell wall biosynthesis
MNNIKPKILVFCDYYLPGYKSGGGMRTIVNMVERLHTEFDFFIVTRDHDGREDFDSYITVKINDWNSLGDSKVFYLPKSDIKISVIKKRIAEIQPNAIYLNSYFATLAIFVLMLKRFRRIPKLNVILAPCGELTEGSLKLKSFKKKTFKFFANILGLYTNLVWKASSDLEVSEIKAVSGKSGTVFVASDLPSKAILPDYKQSQKRVKESGKLRIVFMSRISMKKNLMWFLEVLSQTKENIQFDIIGPIEDRNYWEKCLSLIKSFPKNIKCDYLGSIPNNEVTARMIDYDFFVLPTLSENFGHVFLEALSAGCPLITTDRTPWLNLEEKNIGWDIPLENVSMWHNILKKSVAMENVEYQKLSTASRKFAVDWLADKEIEDATRKVLNYAVNQQVI